MKTWQFHWIISIHFGERMRAINLLLLYISRVY